MAYNVVIEARAREDLEAAAFWYEEKITGLGVRYTDAFLEIVEILEQQAHSFSMVEGEYRQVLMNTFPYFVVYKIDGSFVRIVAVFHTSRNPEKKIKPLK